MPYATKPAASCRDMGKENLLNGSARRKICVRHDRGARLQSAIASSAALFGNGRCELSFANRPHVLGRVRPVADARINEDSRNDTVTGRRICHEIARQIQSPRVRPDMVMRIHNLQLGINGRLCLPGQPCKISSREVPVEPNYVGITVHREIPARHAQFKFTLVWRRGMQPNRCETRLRTWMSDRKAP